MSVGLSLVTNADRERWLRIWDGIVALDEEQSKLKAAIDLLLSENQDLGHVTLDQVREALAAEGVTFKPTSDPPKR